jgi:aminopeptidase YwaD
MTERPLLSNLHKFLLIFSLLAVFVGASGNETSPVAQDAKQPAPLAPNVDATPSVTPPAANSQVCAACIRANMDFLASDALRGRGSGTPDELVAATYIGAQLEQYGVQPAGDDGTYVQRATLIRQTLTAPPELHYMTPGGGIPAQTITWTHGKEMLALLLNATSFRGALQRLDADHTPGTEQEKHPGTPSAGKAYEGRVVLVTGQDRKKIRGAVLAAMRDGAVAVIEPAPPQVVESWDSRGRDLPELPVRLEGGGHAEIGTQGNVIAATDKALEQLKDLPDGVMFYMDAAAGAPKKSYTWNALGKLPGSDPSLNKSALLLSAHLDHLGVGKPVKGDAIYNGADDDASGVVAVLELARAIASGPRRRRPVLFALFGSEELGGIGSAWFQAHPPIPLDEIAVNLEFEMIGRPDPEYPPDSLWLSGWERSNLGLTLAEHGAKLVGDKRPEQNFFRRSDNYVLAKRGIVAQTASSYGMHSDYHQPSDDVAHIDFKHMTDAIGSLIGPVEWLVNSDFRPEWKPGGRP